MNHKNAEIVPHITPQSAAKMNIPFTNAIIPNAPNDMINKPLASPSSPSVKFTEFAVALITNIKSGIYHHPNSIELTPEIGIEMLVNPSFS